MLDVVVEDARACCLQRMVQALEAPRQRLVLVVQLAIVVKDVAIACRVVARVALLEPRGKLRLAVLGRGREADPLRNG